MVHIQGTVGLPTWLNSRKWSNVFDLKQSFYTYHYAFLDFLCIMLFLCIIKIVHCLVNINALGCNANLNENRITPLIL